MDRKGFTLIELIVVIAIIAILAAVVAPTAMRAVERARASSTIEDYQAVKSACFSYNADTGTWPRNGNLGDLRDNTVANAPNYDGPYIDRIPLSRWGAAGVTIGYVRAAGTEFDAVNAEERYITIPGAPAGYAAGSVRARIDGALDNGDGAAAGIVQDVTIGGVATLSILISRG